ncbi:MAG: zinc ribbon domain-containing protein [Bryobacterales bacterium]|nr:zinc ribbon domain-containing protein [Bryobacterales bacterium]
MPRFCVHCGAPQTEGASFCQGCGKPLQPQAAPTPAVPTAPPTPAKPASSSLLKFVLIAFAVIALLGMISVAGVIYAGYRIKNKVEQSAKDHGVNLRDLTSPSSATGRHLDPCALLTREEAEQILNTPIVRADRAGDVCSYYAKPLSAEERQANVQKAFEELQKKAPAADSRRAESPTEQVRESGIGDLARQIAGAANDGSAPLFTVTYTENGKQQIAAMKIAIGAVGGKLASESLEELRGIGDQALLGPMDSMLVVEKNGAGVSIDMRQLPKAKQLAIAMARRIVPRM